MPEKKSRSKRAEWIELHQRKRTKNRRRETLTKEIKKRVRAKVSGKRGPGLERPSQKGAHQGKSLGRGGGLVS